MIKRTEPSAVDGRVVNDMRQKNAPPDLKVVSWPPGASFADLKYYQFDDRVGVTSDIYIIDEGIDAQSTVSKSTTKFGSSHCYSQQLRFRTLVVEKSAVGSIHHD